MTEKHAFVEARAASVYEHWVGSKGLSFRGRDDIERLGDVVKFHWEAVAKDGEVFAVARHDQRGSYAISCTGGVVRRVMRR